MPRAGELGESYSGQGTSPVEPASYSEPAALSSNAEDNEEPEESENEVEAGEAHESKWEETFRRLVAYKAKHGDCLVPYRFAEDPKLGRWVSIQRSHYRKMQEDGLRSCANLNRERIAKLDALGFEWSRKETRHLPWDVRYHELVEYYNKYGNSQVPMGWPENPQLATWVSTQRQEYKFLLQGRDSRLTPDRLQRLEAVNFVWDARKNAGNAWDGKDGKHSPPKRGGHAANPPPHHPPALARVSSAAVAVVPLPPAMPDGASLADPRVEPQLVQSAQLLPLQQSMMPQYVLPSLAQPVATGPLAIPAAFAPPSQAAAGYVQLRAFPQQPMQPQAPPRLLTATVPALPPGGSATIRFVPQPGPAAHLGGGTGPYMLADGSAQGGFFRAPPATYSSAAAGLDPNLQAYLRGRSAAMEAAAQQNQLQLQLQQQHQLQQLQLQQQHQRQQQQLHQATVAAAAAMHQRRLAAVADNGGGGADHHRGDDARGGSRRSSDHSSPASSASGRGATAGGHRGGAPAKTKKIGMESIIPVETSAQIAASGYQLALVPLSVMDRKEAAAGRGGVEEDGTERPAKRSSSKRRHKKRPSSSKPKRKKSKRRKYDSSSSSRSSSSSSDSSRRGGSSSEDDTRSRSGGGGSSRERNGGRGGDDDDNDGEASSDEDDDHRDGKAAEGVSKTRRRGKHAR